MGTSTSLVQGGQVPTRVKGETTCAHHKGNQLDFYCEDCLELVCVKCISTLHKTHPLCQLSEIIPRFRQDIKNFIDQTEKQVLPDNTQLKQKVQDCKTALQAGSNIQIYDAGCDIRSPVTLPVNVSFRPNRSSQDRSVASSAGQGPSSTQQMPEGRKEVSSPVYTLLPQTKVLGEWEAPRNISSVCPTTEGQVWTSYSNSVTLTLWDRKGKVKQEVDNIADIIDISLSPITNTLWASCDCGITELLSGRLVHRFSTSRRPWCICITASDHVIVGMTKHISKFTTKGKLVLTTSAARTGKPLVCTPHRISECPVTHNVAVVDLDRKYDGGKEKRHVVVMDSDLKELFVYDGEIPKTDQPTTQSRGGLCHPGCVVYDSVGNLVIGDRCSSRVLLISGRGEFLKLIHTYDYWECFAVGVDREVVLWMGSVLA